MKLQQLLAVLTDAGVRFSVIGGVGLGSYEHVDAASDELEIAGTKLLVLTLDGLERAKRAAGRPNDLVDLGYINAIRSR